MNRIPPPARVQTARERLGQVLGAGPATLRELSQAAGLSEREVLSHLLHLQKSLRSQGRRLEITPSTCLDCCFTFLKRDRLTRPGKCPVCRSTRLSDPLFAVG